ncbi:MAG: hypothetical protein KIS77_19330 [Saprospiraceae bacterium]|nr:hypothetical protein [Saprospiraceae bacterium]
MEKPTAPRLKSADPQRRAPQPAVRRCFSLQPAALLRAGGKKSGAASPNSAGGMRAHTLGAVAKSPQQETKKLVARLVRGSEAHSTLLDIFPTAETQRRRDAEGF